MFLCLCHVRKTWAENAIKNNSIPENNAKVLSALGENMYSLWMPY